MKEGCSHNSPPGSWCHCWRVSSRMLPSALPLIKSHTVHGDTDPIKSGTCSWVVVTLRSGPVYEGYLISFSTQITARDGSCWSLMEQTSAER